jgi:hypothetical protein
MICFDKSITYMQIWPSERLSPRDYWEVQKATVQFAWHVLSLATPGHSSTGAAELSKSSYVQPNSIVPESDSFQVWAWGEWFEDSLDARFGVPESHLARTWLVRSFWMAQLRC